jgi:hypothetical protein
MTPMSLFLHLAQSRTVLVCHFQKDPCEHHHCFVNIFTTTNQIQMFLLFLKISHTGERLLLVIRKYFCENSLKAVVDVNNVFHGLRPCDIPQGCTV